MSTPQEAPGAPDFSDSPYLPSLPDRAETLAHLAVACRQISGMMEAGVDILRITQVVRSQLGAQDEDILRLCARIDFDLTQGRALSDALADEPGLFSPFTVTLVRQGEERNTLAQAFARVAQAIDTERAELLQSSAFSSARANTSAIGIADDRPQVLAGTDFTSARASAASVIDSRTWPEIGAQLERAEARWLRTASSIGAGLLAASAASEALIALGLVPTKWRRPLSRTLSAAVLAVAALGARNAESQTGDDAVEVYQSRRQTPQVLEAPDSVDDFDTKRAPQHTQDRAPVAEENVAPNAVYSGAPREDEEEAPRLVRRPRGEEEFD